MCNMMMDKYIQKQEMKEISSSSIIDSSQLITDEWVSFIRMKHEATVECDISNDCVGQIVVQWWYGPIESNSIVDNYNNLWCGRRPQWKYTNRLSNRVLLLIRNYNRRPNSWDKRKKTNKKNIGKTNEITRFSTYNVRYINGDTNNYRTGKLDSYSFLQCFFSVYRKCLVLIVIWFVFNIVDAQLSSHKHVCMVEDKSFHIGKWPGGKLIAHNGTDVE